MVTITREAVRLDPADGPADPDAFALGTFDSGDGPFAGLVAHGSVLDLDRYPGLLPDGEPRTAKALLSRWDRVLPVLTALAGSAGDWMDPGDLRVLSPVRARQVFQVGTNYHGRAVDAALAHRASGDHRPGSVLAAEVAARMGTEPPYLFLGPPTALAGAYDDLVLPPHGLQYDWELELAAVISRPGYRIRVEDGLDHVAGYLMVIDITARDLVLRPGQAGPDWLQPRNYPGFLPCGPYLVPASFVPNPRDLRIRLRLNDEIVQDGSTRDLEFDVATLVSAASRLNRLLPGDLVLTGSPAGDAASHGRMLRPGDVLEGEITGLGRQRIACASAGAAAPAAGQK